jgi:hypothetical protein
MNTLTQTSSAAPLATSQKAGTVKASAALAPVHTGNSWGRMLAATLLAAAVAALAVVADRLVATWSDGDLLATWLALWGVVFAGSLLLAGTARRVAQRVMAGLDGWAQQRATRRAEARFQRLARADARLMADLAAVRFRETVPAATPADHSGYSGHSAAPGLSLGQAPTEHDVQANHDALAPMGVPGLDLPSWVTLGLRPSLSTYVGWAQGRKYDVYYI